VRCRCGAGLPSLPRAPKQLCRPLCRLPSVGESALFNSVLCALIVFALYGAAKAVDAPTTPALPAQGIVGGSSFDPKQDLGNGLNASARHRAKSNDASAEGFCPCWPLAPSLPADGAGRAIRTCSMPFLRVHEPKHVPTTLLSPATTAPISALAG